MLSLMETWLVKMELVVADMRDPFENVDLSIKKPKYEGDDEVLRGEMQDPLNSTVNKLSKKDETLEAMVVDLEAEVVQLKEFKVRKVANGCTVAHLPIPK